MTTRRDPWVNMLRTTVATFSAGLGGADSITVLPFTAALGLPDAFARRVARNTHLILIEEANLARVADPASGAGGFEALTDALCEKAWGLFQAIERDGGIVESLKRGALQREIAEVRVERDKAVATRRDPITGTSEFPNLAEGDVAVLMPSPLWNETKSAPRGAIPASRNPPPHRRPFPNWSPRPRAASHSRNWPARRRAPSPLAIEPLPSIRTARTLRAPARSRPTRLWRGPESDPRIFLATLGSPAAYHRPRGLRQEFLRGGRHRGRDAGGNLERGRAHDGVSRKRRRVICLCSSDALYAEGWASTALAALRPLTAGPIYVAGRPADCGRPRSRPAPPGSSMRAATRSRC